jgi:hypothetical protein
VLPLNGRRRAGRQHPYNNRKKCPLAVLMGVFGVLSMREENMVLKKAYLIVL